MRGALNSDFLRYAIPPPYMNQEIMEHQKFGLSGPKYFQHDPTSNL